MPLKNIFTKNGYLNPEVPNYGGLKIKEARERIIQDLSNENLVVKVDEIEHDVQVHERCGKEVEDEKKDHHEKSADARNARFNPIFGELTCQNSADCNSHSGG